MASSTLIYRQTKEALVTISNYTITKSPDFIRLQASLNADPAHPHIHAVDMPYRLSSTWQDQGCEMGLWEKRGELIAWAVFQPPWLNLDYVICPSERGSTLEKEVFAWGKEQMMHYARQSGEEFYGSVELFENTPEAGRTITHLKALGFEKFDWSIIRFQKDLDQELPQPQLPEGYSIRPFRGESEIESYVKLHRAAFGSEKMTTDWRRRTFEHPAYQPKIDLVVVSPEDDLVGFCVCWISQEVGQIEPLGVHPEHQGKGIGRALELAALQALRGAGARSMHVDHVSENKEAITLSVKTGFQKINNAMRYFIPIDPNGGG